MGYEYNDIVHQFFEEYKTLFVNYLHKNYQIDYDDIMNIYIDTWIDVRDNIMRGKVKQGTKWKAYIMQIGIRKAMRFKERKREVDSMDDERFNREQFEKVYTESKEAETSIYEDPDLQAVLAAELSYIPDPCNKILKLYYFDGFSMKEIADAMNYSGPRTAITTNNRCKDKLRERILNAIRRLGILD